MSKPALKLPVLVAIVGVSILGSFLMDGTPKPQETEPAFIEIETRTPTQIWQDWLKNELHRQGMTEDRDYTIVHEIVFCESSWEQYWQDGTVKVSNGNIGLSQVNRIAHEEEYLSLGLDMENPLDNLTYAVILYKREGIKPWEKWSGHCWKPRLEDKGIFFDR